MNTHRGQTVRGQATEHVSRWGAGVGLGERANQIARSVNELLHACMRCVHPLPGHNARQLNDAISELLLLQHGSTGSRGIRVRARGQEAYAQEAVDAAEGFTCCSVKPGGEPSPAASSFPPCVSSPCIQEAARQRDA